MINPGRMNDCPFSMQGAVMQIEKGTGHVFFAYDMGLSIDLNEAERRITEVKQRETIRHKRRAPQYFEYDPPPLRLTQEIEPLSIGAYRTQPTVETMIYGFGAVSVAYGIPLNGPMSALLALSDELYGNELLLADSRRRVEQLLAAITPAVNKPGISQIIEDYAIYQIEALNPAMSPEKLLYEHGPLIAQILQAEFGTLAEQQVKEALSCRLSFARDDMVIIDWNAAILLDTDADDVRAVLQYTNVELLEMRLLDDQLDDAMDESYAALSKRAWLRRQFFKTPFGDLRRIAEMQVDGALLFEGVNNALKLLGDQYLARVYSSASQRLHLNDWDSSILRKLQTLESIYQKMSDQQAHWQMIILEWIIIILIAVSIALSFIPGLTGH